MYVQFVELILLLVFEDVSVVNWHPVILVVDEWCMFDFEVKEIFVVVDTLITVQIIIIFKLIIC